MEYYIASDKGPLGPYTTEQLEERRLQPDEMVWRNGLPEWTRADALPELANAVKARPVPPIFDRGRYFSANPGLQQPGYSYRGVPAEACPPTYRWLAIIAFLGIIPCAIVALIKSTMVTRLYEEGNYEGARRQSRSVLVWGLTSVLIGIPLSIYIMFFSEGAAMSDLFQQLL